MLLVLTDGNGWPKLLMASSDSVPAATRYTVPAARAARSAVRYVCYTIVFVVWVVLFCFDFFLIGFCLISMLNNDVDEVINIEWALVWNEWAEARGARINLFNRMFALDCVLGVCFLAIGVMTMRVSHIFELSFFSCLYNGGHRKSAARQPNLLDGQRETCISLMAHR